MLQTTCGNTHGFHSWTFVCLGELGRSNSTDEYTTISIPIYTNCNAMKTCFTYEN